MKNTIFVFYAMLFMILFNLFETPVAIAACLCSGIAISLLWNKIDKFFLLREYANEIENIYVVSNDPETNEEVFHESLNQFIVNVKFSKVMIEVQNQKDLLQESGNEIFADGQLEVKPFIFQNGEFINETFEEFQLRVIETIKEDRKKRHLTLKNVNEDWYQKFSNYQEGIDFEK